MRVWLKDWALRLKGSGGAVFKNPKTWYWKADGGALLVTLSLSLEGQIAWF